MAEEQLINQAALARLGEMVAVVAHEVRNPLAGLRGVLQILSQRLEPQRSEHSIVLEMIKRLDGLNARVNDLLLYAKPRTPRLEAVPLRPLIESTMALLNRDPALAATTSHVQGDHVSCLGDAELLREALLNLLLNAAQAMGGRGTIGVTIAGGARATVDIADSGPGIPSDDRPEDLRAVLHHQTGRHRPGARHRSPAAGASERRRRRFCRRLPPERPSRHAARRDRLACGGGASSCVSPSEGCSVRL